jgi:hypothetical protein
MSRLYDRVRGFGCEAFRPSYLMIGFADADRKGDR